MRVRLAPSWIIKFYDITFRKNFSLLPMLNTYQHEVVKKFLIYFTLQTQ